MASAGDQDTRARDQTSAPALRASLLGRFELHVGGRPVPDTAWQRRKARQLLKLLLTRPSHRLTKDELYELLWPESDPEAAATNLRSTVHALRRALSGASDAADSELLEVQRETVGLRPDLELWVDAEAFEQAIAEAQQADDPLPYLEAADALYLGDLLPDDLYESWPTERREALKRTWVDLQLALAQQWEQRGDLERALAALHRLLQADPCDERAARRLIRRLARHGRRAEALRVYQRLVQALRQELDTEPSQATLELGQQLTAAPSSEPPEPVARAAEAGPTGLLGGTVTLLFTDIEGSTRLLRTLGDDYATLLGQHHQLLRAVFQAHGGQELSMQGDGFFVAFRRAADAVATAVEAQRALAAQPWPRAATVAVRMGLHTGEPALSSGTYVGLDVHRAARICDAAHGGQVLLSRTTRDLVALDLPDGVQLHDLGEHWLKDLRHPEQLYQLAIAGLPADFPPLRGVNVGQTHLPALRRQLIGREREVAELSHQVQGSQIRLLTILGPGGVGKTSVAVAVAEALLGTLEHGACFVALAPLHDPGLVLSAIAHALGIRETGSLPLRERLIARLNERPPLLILDNFEHLTAAATVVAELLMTCPELKVLVTSREALHVYGEHEFPLLPLAVPELGSLPSLEELAPVPAVNLFVQRAQAIRTSFTLSTENAGAVAEICVRLDGLPLAIELAAARVNVLSPAAILARLESRLALLTGGARDWPARHRTLRGAIDWSHDLLEPLEQVLFRRLAVFRGGWTLEASEAVCAGDGLEPDAILELLSHLVDKSLVVADDRAGETRFHLLEIIREYGTERLREAGEDPILLTRHLEWALALGEQAEASSYGPDHPHWLTRLQAEQDNLRAALDWSARRGAADPAAAEPGLRLAVALWRFWEIRGLLSEGRAVLAKLLPLAPERAPARTRATALAAFLAMLQGDMEQARALAEPGLPPARELGDPLALIFLSAALVNSSRDRDELGLAVALVEECRVVSRTAGSWFGEATALFFLGQVALSTGDHPRAEAYYRESLALAKNTGDRWAIAHPVARLGHLALLRGDYQQATALCRDSLAARRDLEHARGVPEVLAELGWIAAAQGQAARAAQLLGAADILRERAGTVVLPAFQAEHDRAVQAARTQLGEAAFAAAWAAGRAFPSRTIAEALADPPAANGPTPPASPIQTKIGSSA